MKSSRDGPGAGQPRCRDGVKVRGSSGEPKLRLLRPKDNEPVCPALSTALCVPEMPLGGDSWWPHNSHLECRAGRSSSRDGPAASLPENLVSASLMTLTVLGTLLWGRHLSPRGPGLGNGTNDPPTSSPPPPVLTCTCLSCFYPFYRRRETGHLGLRGVLTAFLLHCCHLHVSWASGHRALCFCAQSPSRLSRGPDHQRK